MKSTLAVAGRIAAAGLVTGVVAALGVATPASAADPAPDLAIGFTTGDILEVRTHLNHLGVDVFNHGPGVAGPVTLTIDLSGLDDRVTASASEYATECQQAGAMITCTYDGLAASEWHTVYPLDIQSKTGAALGSAGSLVFKVDSAEEDNDPSNDTASLPVTVIASGPDLVAAAEHMNTAATPVGPGDRRGLRGGVYNEGDSTAEGVILRIGYPTGATVVERYDDCEYPNDVTYPGGYQYGPWEATCILPVPLAPGEAFPLHDDETGESAFTILFGTNLAGPENTHGAVSVELPEEDALAKVMAKATGAKSLTSKVRKLKERFAAKTPAQRKALIELDTNDNYANYDVWTKPNKFDAAVTVAPVAGRAGDTVTVKILTVNHGPSDSGGPGVDIVAPAGSVFLPEADISFPFACRPPDDTGGPATGEVSRLRCFVDSYWPTKVVRGGALTLSLQMKIKEAPTAAGTVTIAGLGPSSESSPANNTARIVIGLPDGNPGLPATGDRTAPMLAIGAAVLLLGSFLYVVARRRRVRLVTPPDNF